MFKIFESKRKNGIHKILKIVITQAFVKLINGDWHLMESISSSILDLMLDSSSSNPLPTQQPCMISTVCFVIISSVVRIAVKITDIPVDSSDVVKIKIGDWKKNKKRIVPSLDVTKSDFKIGFSVVDLVENEVWLMDLFLKCGIFQRLKSEK